MGASVTVGSLGGGSVTGSVTGTSATMIWVNVGYKISIGLPGGSVTSGSCSVVPSVAASCAGGFAFAGSLFSSCKSTQNLLSPSGFILSRRIRITEFGKRPNPLSGFCLM